MYQRLIRPLFFLFDPEKIHHTSFRLIKLVHLLGLGGLIKRLFQVNDPSLSREVFGLKFPKFQLTTLFLHSRCSEITKHLRPS